MRKIVLIFLVLLVSTAIAFRFSNKKIKTTAGAIDDDLENFICEYHSTRPTCKKSRYRHIDGSCNNKKNPLWGTAFSPFARLLDAEYSDFVRKMPTSLTGKNLPNPRHMSKKIFSDRSVKDVIYNVANMQFGQIMAHDMSFGLGSSGRSCCSHGKLDSKIKKCDAIHIFKNDSVYSQVDWNCMQFMRNANDQDLWCTDVDKIDPIKQLSTTTTFLELSLVYGDVASRGKLLRAFKDGLMKVDVRHGKEWPPRHHNAEVNCILDDPSDPCYLSSDARINSNPGLAIIQVWYLREHNRLARELAKINPHWKDERLFQEARRINIAQYQHVTYYEWLPIFLGEKNMLRDKLIYPVKGGEYINDYNPNKKPVIYNEHAQAANRLFHSQIQGLLELTEEDRSVSKVLKLSDTFFKPKLVEKHFDQLGRGMIAQPAQNQDQNYDPEITDKLFKGSRPFGDDLRAIDIQRGRDHGVAFYNNFREFCGLKRAKKWEDYSDFIEQSDLNNLKEVYENFEDVELSVGAALEKFSEEVQSGPTILCINTIQFLNTRITDRYWFESGDPEVRFTKDQLAEIRKSSFARLVCDNSNNIKNVQKESFKFVLPSNPIVPCTSINKVDLSKWKESQSPKQKQR